MDDGHHGSGGPVWARSSRRGGGGGLVGILVVLLALFGAVTLGLAIKERSVAEGGAVIDGWISSAWSTIRGASAEADEAAAEAAGEARVEASEAVASAGDAVEQGAERAAENLRG
ncbi:hypothetical protein Q0812_06335 [Brevundimonas sp. 2R-24]|uniref:Uncharacterized protein n=1 Tax=Peiella sedimenti TaxID=3061083 RepID=A0ABT8SKK7_9CAUL|nr:hypothetical protein [Caulobacteraceae bacterium XZ-24]